MFYKKIIKKLTKRPLKFSHDIFFLLLSRSFYFLSLVIICTKRYNRVANKSYGIAPLKTNQK